MMCELVMPSTAPPELLARMVDVINVYFEHNPRIRSEYMDKCEEKLRLPGWHMNYARLLEHLIRQEVTRDSVSGSMMRVCCRQVWGVGAGGGRPKEGQGTQS